MATVKEIKENVQALLNETENSMKNYDGFFIPALNMLIFENNTLDKNLKLSKGITAKKGTPRMSKLNDVLTFEEEIALDVIPLGMAARLIIESDSQRSAVFTNLYNQARSQFNKARVHQIKEVF